MARYCWEVIVVLKSGREHGIEWSIQGGTEARMEYERIVSDMGAGSVVSVGGNHFAWTVRSSDIESVSLNRREESRT